MSMNIDYKTIVEECLYRQVKHVPLCLVDKCIVCKHEHYSIIQCRCLDCGLRDTDYFTREHLLN